MAAVLVGAATINSLPDLDAEALLDTLGSLTTGDLLILAWVGHGRLEKRFHVSDLPAELQGPDLDFHLHRLEAAGMIRYVADRPTKGYDWRIYDTTATFDRMMKLIDESGGLSPL